MSRFGRSAFLFACLVGLGLVLGMQLASSGMRSVYGPSWDQTKPTEVDAGDFTQTVVEDTPAVPLPPAPSMTVAEVEGQTAGEIGQAQSPLQQVPRTDEASVDVMADKTAGLLQQASKKGIEWVVSVFDGLTN
ncbi:hypothetical protein OIN60_09580 [Paenibacillus sp. P96]|uniref:DUF3679 domain-containing protein n=1 Tax=Paenibacillus zeirhizosphaerae TaxID=2987519 RepID=A0ABT9FQL0_9BACL|nr:hypothetical protein [Paenibacillus sp. P96]MDP4097019.1 hypothetical protein [Paenibacillus sp. P96]